MEGAEAPIRPLILSILIATTGAALAAAEGAPRSLQDVDGDARDEYFRNAQVWRETDVAAVDIRRGPEVLGAFAPGETVDCTYVPEKLTGSSPKFMCKAATGEPFKVKFRAGNGEVFAEVVASRLLWALGFAADAMYPVRVRCRGCSADPWIDKRAAEGVRELFPASIERKLGVRIGPDGGWGWEQLDRVDDERGAPRAHRDALRLLAVLMQHRDNKPSQQRLVCPEASVQKGPAGETCTAPLLVVHDVGLTFGGADFWNRNQKSSFHLGRWSALPVWKDRDRCIGHLPRSGRGSMDDPVIREAGRRFLADLLVQLSDAQIRDLFDVAQAPLRVVPGDSRATGTVDQWVAAFKRKRDDVVLHSCPR